MTLDNILEEIKKADKIVILTHETPDGDACRKQFSYENSIKAIRKRSRCNNG